MSAFGIALGGTLGKLAGGLVGKLFGGDDKPKFGLKRLRKAAEKNGFNPLTVLGATGGQGYRGPQLSTAAFIADAISAGVDTYYNAKAEEDAEAKRLKEQAEREARAAASRVLPRHFGYAPGSPVTVHGPSVSREAISQYDPNAPRSSSDDASKTPERALTYFGVPLFPSPWFVDAEADESRYGEADTEIEAFAKLPISIGRRVADVAWSFPKWSAMALAGQRFDSKGRPYGPRPRPPLAGPYLDKHFAPFSGEGAWFRGIE